MSNFVLSRGRIWLGVLVLLVAGLATGNIWGRGICNGINDWVESIYDPLDAPISINPKGSFDWTVQIRAKEVYSIKLVLAYGKQLDERALRLTGCWDNPKYDYKNPTEDYLLRGIAVPLRWSILDEAGRTVASQTLTATETNGSSCSTASDGSVLYRLGDAVLSPGSHRVRVDITKDVPELNEFRASIILEKPLRDPESAIGKLAMLVAFGNALLFCR